MRCCVQLLPLPNSFSASPDDGENADLAAAGTRIRGNLDWAPPRKQIILNVHAAPKRKVILAQQNFRCAGCGTRVKPGLLQRLRYCEYLAKYFCQCCHNNRSAVLPARVLKLWDFRKRYVSNFAHELLRRFVSEPLLSESELAPAVLRRHALHESRQRRRELHHQAKYISGCSRIAADGPERAALDSVPEHWYSDYLMWSLTDFFTVRSGEMVVTLRKLVSTFDKHIKACELCQMKGFICELCQKNDVIYPFELNLVQLCPDCQACFHKECFIPNKCPRCARKEVKKHRQYSSIDEDEV